MTTISINQPAYLPWLGYFNRIVKSNLHIVLDHVQFEKNSFTNRNRILLQNHPTWLTLPVITRNLSSNLWIHKLTLDPRSKWQNKHWRTLEQAYSKKPYWSEIYTDLKHFYQLRFDLLNDALKESTKILLKYLEINTPIIYSSEQGFSKKKSDLILEICQRYQATKYISGPLGRNYLDLERFREENIEIVFDDYPHPQYIQAPGVFIPYMSVLDLIVNHGKDSRGILTND